MTAYNQPTYNIRIKRGEDIDSYVIGVTAKALSSASILALYVTGITSIPCPTS